MIFFGLLLGLLRPGSRIETYIEDTRCGDTGRLGDVIALLGDECSIISE
jgi:hypothetical protein